MTQITQENLLAGMRQAVEQRGLDYVYPKDNPNWYDNMCLYATRDTGEPACLLGQAIYNISPELFLDIGDGEGIADVLQFSFGVDDPHLQRAAERAQDAQDNGAPWGEALEVFETTLGL